MYVYIYMHICICIILKDSKIEKVYQLLSIGHIYWNVYRYALRQNAKSGVISSPG